MKNDKEKVFEPVKIGYDERGSSNKLYQLKYSIEKLSTFRIQVENLGLSWDTDTLMDFITNGAINSENKILNMIQDEVSRCIFPGRREALERELNDTIYHDFKQLRSDMRSAKPDCDPKYLSIEHGTVILTDEGKKAIEESFIIWAETPEELELWTEATELVERLQKLDSRLKPFGIYGIAEFDVNSPTLIRISNTSVEANPFTLKECNDKSLWKGRRID